MHTDARGYVRAIAAGQYEEAYLIARGPNPLASICGRICGAPCEAACRRGKVPRVDDDGNFVGLDEPVAIRALKRFVCERHGPEALGADRVRRQLESYVPRVSWGPEEMAALIQASIKGRFRPANGQSVAIVGAGPAGLAAAHDLALMGFRPVVYEMEPVPAGMLALGVPAYRLPGRVIESEVAVIRALGVEILCGIAVGKHVSFGDLRRSHAAVIVACGAKSSRALGLAGERGPGVFGGVDLLRAVALGQPVAVGRNVVVIGGGNVAYDVARTVLRQIAYDTARTAARMPGTARVRLVALESLEEMPADTVEIREVDEEGIERLNGWGPVEVLRDGGGGVTGVAFRRCLRVYDDERRFAPVFDDAERIVFDCDTVLLAVGQEPVTEFLRDGGQDIEMARPGWPKIDPRTLATTARGVFVAGDLAHGTRLLIDAVAPGKAAARSVYEFVTGRRLEAEALTAHLVDERYRRERGYEAIRRVQPRVLPPEERLKDPATVVEQVYSEEEARREASRCLDCGVTPVFDGSRCVLCGGCADVCPTLCLKLVPLSRLEGASELDELARAILGQGADFEEHTAIVKDEERCIRCAACAMRCPSEAITMERIMFRTEWKLS